jgi:hypothetical protein
MSVAFRLTGAAAMRTRLLHLAARAPTVVGQALRTEAEIEMAEAKRRTPVDTDALRSSGLVTGPNYSSGRIAVELAFGGPAAPYALYVHEDLEAFHPVGQAKFLESTLHESGPHLIGRVGRRVERALR